MRTYSRDFKLQVVKQMLIGEKSVAQICREHGVGENVVRRWKHEYEDQDEAAWQGPPSTGGVFRDEPFTTLSSGADTLSDKRPIQE